MSKSNIQAVGAELAAVLPIDQIPWYKKSHLRSLNFSIISCVLFSAANGYDGSMMNGLQSLQQWQSFMNFPTGAWLGFINAVTPLGACMLYPAVVWMVGKYGRKSAILLSYFWLVLGVSIQSAAQNPTMFVLGRLFVGGVSSCVSVAAICLIAETAYPTHRGILTAMYNTGWYVGSLIAAWATFGTRDIPRSWAWRIPSMLQFAVPLIALPGFLLAPESPRWLVSVDQHEKARNMLVKYHAGGDESSPLVAFELEEIDASMRLERLARKKTSYLDMFRTPGNRHRFFISLTLGIAAQWNGSGVVSYYLSLVLKTAGITSVTQQTLINGFLQLWNLIIAVSAALFVDRVGRRFLFLASCIGMLTSYVLITALSGSFATTSHKATGLAIIPMLFIYYGFYDIAFTPLLIAYPTEIWPYALRARGVTVTSFSTQLAVFFNIFVNPIALESIDWKYYIVFVGLLVVFLLNCYFFYPETRGHSLEEIARIFDKEDATVKKRMTDSDHVEEVEEENKL
ncbi:general substrate transporter [Cadophora sp. DSE1049]|nr:general substrate transporter [Cadophora sp. DSE1049]